MKLEDYNKYYIQGSDHYLIPKDEFKELFNEMLSWKEESQKQKEIIDRIKKYINPLATDKDDKEYYPINFYVKDVLLSMLKEVS